MSDPYLFSSARLGFRNWQETDFSRFAAINQHPEVMQYFPAPFTPEETREQIQRFQQHFTDYGYTFYAVDHLASKELIGFIGMVYQTMEALFTPCVEIGWRLHPNYWKKGLATEGAKKCLEVGFEQLGFTEIYSITAVPNKPSEQVMKRIGMEKIGVFDHPKVASGHWLEEHVIYRIRT